jgi:hypothetical protein
MPRCSAWLPSGLGGTFMVVDVVIIAHLVLRSQIQLIAWVAHRDFGGAGLEYFSISKKQDTPKIVGE